MYQNYSLENKGIMRVWSKVYFFSLDVQSHPDYDMHQKKTEIMYLHITIKNENLLRMRLQVEKGTELV